MKKYILLFIAIMAFTLFCNEIQNEINYANLYFSNPGAKTFAVAEKYYVSILEKDSTDVDSRLMLSYLYLYEMQRTIAPVGENIDSLEPKHMFQYANLLLSLCQYEESIKIYDKINKKLPQWSCPWRHKGEAYFKSDKLEDAEIALKKSIETRTEHYDAYVMLADVQKAMGKYETALETLELGLSYYGKDIENPEEEVATVDVQFLHLELLKLNDMTEEYNRLKESMKKTFPDDVRWENCK